MSFFTAFNPNNLQNGTLSNGNLTFTQSGATIGGCCADVQLAFGLKYFEFTLVSFSGAANTHSVGVAQYGINFTQLGTNAFGAFLIYLNNGNISVNSVATGISLGALANGDIIRVAINFNAKLGWFARNGGTWNNSGTANPATNTGGINLTMLPTYLAPVAVGQASTTDSITINSGGSAFTFAVPAGYDAGWASVDALPYWDFRSIRRKIYYWEDPTADEIWNDRIRYRLARTNWVGSLHTSVAAQVSKFIQLAILVPSDNAVSVSKFVQYAALAEPAGAVSVSKFVQYVVLDGTPYILNKPRRRALENPTDEQVRRKNKLYRHNMGVSVSSKNAQIQTFVIT